MRMKTAATHGNTPSIDVNNVNIIINSTIIITITISVVVVVSQPYRTSL